MQTGKAYWEHGRTFVPVVIGRKHITGLVIEADGFHTYKLPLSERLPTVQYRGQDYPTRRLLAFLRKRRGASDTAEALRKRVIAEMAS